MSSTVLSTELESISKKSFFLTHRKMEAKPQRLVRTSSLEKIRRFNSFICSQQYYVLPALLAWLRNSQSGLQSSAEKTIFFFRSLIFSHFLYKIYQLEFRSMLTDVLVWIKKQVLLSFDRIEPTFVLKLAVYLTGLILVTELALCFYLLCSTYVPSGLVFLIICFFYIIYLNVKSVYFMDKRKADVIKKKK